MLDIAKVFQLIRQFYYEIYFSKYKFFMKNKLDELEKRERLQRAKNKFQLIRRQMNDNKSNKHKLLALVREYVAQRPEVTVQIMKKWIG